MRALLLGAALLGLQSTASAQARATIEPYCDNAIRVRVTSLPWVPHGPATVDASAGALQPTCGGGCKQSKTKAIELHAMILLER
jgi:hypothetical protein